MTVYLLLSDREPPFEILRRRLSSESRKVFVVVLSESLPVQEILKRASLSLSEPLSGFEQMPGIHRIECLGATLLLSRMSRDEFRKSAEVFPDVVIDDSLDQAGLLKRLMAKGAFLVCSQRPKAVPPFLVETSEGFRLKFLPPSLQRQTEKMSESSVLIVGAGLAGCMVAWELSKRGFQTTVIDGGMVAGSAASALYAGLIHPHWQASDSPLFQLTRQGFSAMQALLRRFPSAFLPVGVVDAASSEDEFERWKRAYAEGRPIPMSSEFATLLSREEANHLTGLTLSRGGWYFPKAGLVHAGQLCRQLLEESGAIVIPNTKVRLIREGNLWTAVNDWGDAVARASKAVVAAALGSSEVLGVPRHWLGMSGLYGRISLLRDTDLPGLSTALTGDGYIAKTKDGFCAVGATYEPGEERRLSVAEAHSHNLSTFTKLTGTMPSVIARGFYEGIRAVAQDRMPLVGRGLTQTELRGLQFKGVPEVRAIPRADNLWLCTGFGSRGITWGLACAEALASEMAEEPQTLTRAMKASLDPARFMPKILGMNRTGGKKSVSGN